MVCTRHDLAFAIGLLDRYQSNLRISYQDAIKRVLDIDISWEPLTTSFISGLNMHLKGFTDLKRVLDILWELVIE